MIRIFVLLLALLTAAPAHAAVEIAFYSHELQASGNGERIVEFPHAFVTMRGIPDAGGKAIDGNYGFTADRISPAILIGPVKGRMVSAGRAYVRASRNHLALRLSDAQYAAVRAAYRRWAGVKGKSYDLETRNCVHFVAAMAKAVGLALPTEPDLMKSPATFLERLAARNRGVASTR